MGKKISFVSSKNRGITLDMLVVKDFFRVNDEKVEFKDVVANENAKNSLVKKGNISIRKFHYCFPFISLFSFIIVRVFSNILKRFSVSSSPSLSK